MRFTLKNIIRVSTAVGIGIAIYLSILTILIATFGLLVWASIDFEKFSLLGASLQSVLIGVGTVIGSLSVAPIVGNWLTKQKRKNIIADLKSQYPLDELGISYRIVFHIKYPGPVYLLDLKTFKLRHIANPETLNDLDFTIAAYHSEEPDILTKEEVEKKKITVGATINTKAD